MFDKVLKPNVTQEQVYNGAAKHIVKGNFCLHFTFLTSFSPLQNFNTSNEKFVPNCFDDFYMFL